MNRNLLIAGAVVILIILGAGALMFMNKNKSTNTLPEASNTDQKPNVISSIRDALTGGVSIECAFSDEQGRTTKSYIKNGMVRADITSTKPEESGSTIVKDKKIYFWNSKGGFVMEIPDVTVTPGAGTANPTGALNQDELIASMEKYKENCKTASVSDALFTIPSDVKFQDLSSLIKTVPSGKATSPVVDQKQVEELIKQYQNPSN